ncbi:Protein of unknown function [Gryllus bimaculatus]|nr:Protein of unknown function [Gryllus bimaculatus]
MHFRYEQFFLKTPFLYNEKYLDIESLKLKTVHKTNKRTYHNTFLLQLTCLKHNNILPSFPRVCTSVW